jgi:hypothetical protein
MSEKPKRDDNIDYRVDQRLGNGNTEQKLPFWQISVYALLVAMLVTSFVVIFNLNGKMDSLRKQNSGLRAAIRGQMSSLYPDSAKRSLSVNGQPAICVQGNWNESNEWSAAADTTTLVWSINSISKSVSQSGLKLSCEDLSRLTKSLISKP